MKKKNCIYVMCLALFALVFFGCKKVEQTELNIGDSQYSAIIQGTLFYPAGVTLSDDGGKPITGKVVFIDVPYYYYSEGTPGVKRFQTITDNQGKFSIKIPATIEHVTGTLSVEAFQGKHFIFEQFVKEGEVLVPKFVEKDVIYKIGDIPVTISASGIINKNLTLAYDLIGYEPEFKFTANFRFNVEQIYYPAPTGPPYVYSSDEWIPQKGKDAIIKVSRNYKDYYYIGKSNNYGLVSVDIPIIDIAEQIHISVSSNPYRGNQTLYEISNDQQSYSSVNINGLFSTPGIDDWYYLKALQPTSAESKIQFFFTPDQK
ncbi:MAG: hypothetical protein LBU83_10945 [Bacteroidales bacterium]|jgi:hypothetical protein|nr:hypothetical protein [Bacteroidales bacterium]